MSAEMNGYRPPMDGGGETRVLVIDDEAPIRLLCRVNLEAEGMQVLEAADGTTGLDLAREEQPDVVLLDVMMPGLDGWRVAEELLEDELTSGIPMPSSATLTSTRSCRLAAPTVTVPPSGE